MPLFDMLTPLASALAFLLLVLGILALVPRFFRL